MVKRQATGAIRRARQMMIGRLLAGHTAGITACDLTLATGSRAALIGAALGFAAVIIFCSVGQTVEAVICELEPVQGLGLVLVSYAIRVVEVEAGIWFTTSHPQLGSATDRNWLAAVVITTVLARTTGVVVVVSRQHVPIYDIHGQD